MMKNSRPVKPVKIDRASRSIAGIYLLISALWNFFSDRLLLALSLDPTQLARFQTLKGWLFVLFTAALLHLLVRRTLTRMRIFEQGALESAERYRYLFDKNPHPMWIYDLETLSILAVNGAAVAHYGYDRDEFLSLTIKDIRPADDIPALLKRKTESTDGLGRSGVWRHR
jgi:PAS domain-containing protein